MINYADYEFYTNTYKGSLSDSLFNSLIPKASREIDKAINKDYLTKEDLSDEIIKYKVNFVACELVDFLNNNNTNAGENGNSLSSVSVDGVSKTFATKTNEEIKSEKANILSGLPLELIRFL